MQNGDALRDRSPVDDANASSVDLVEFIACEFYLRRIDDYEGVAGGLFKFVCFEGAIHLEARLLASLFSVLRRREAGRKVALSSRPVLPNCSAIDV